MHSDGFLARPLLSLRQSARIRASCTRSRNQKRKSLVTSSYLLLIFYRINKARTVESKRSFIVSREMRGNKRKEDGGWWSLCTAGKIRAHRTTTGGINAVWWISNANVIKGGFVSLLSDYKQSRSVEKLWLFVREKSFCASFNRLVEDSLKKGDFTK